MGERGKTKRTKITAEAIKCSGEFLIGGYILKQNFGVDKMLNFSKYKFDILESG